MGQTAENLVDLHNISREDQDAFACRSQLKAAAARRKDDWQKRLWVGHSAPQAGSASFNKTNSSNPTSLEVLAKLRPAFRKEEERDGREYQRLE